MTSAPFRQQNEWFYALNHFLNSPQPNSELAKRIAFGYKKLWPALGKTWTIKQEIEIEKLDFKEYAETKYLQILTELQKYFAKYLKNEVASLIIHGSVATMDWAEGFSDLDTFAIIKKEFCESPEKLETLRRKISAIRGLLKKADPLEHHGFIFCHEGNLNFYNQRFLPMEVFRYAKVLSGENKLNFHIRNSHQENLENFEHYYQIFKEIAKTGAITHKAGSPDYKLKWFVAMLLLMPNIYLQAKEIYVYKRFAFDFVKHPFLKKIELARKNFAASEKLLGKDYYRSALAMLDEWKKNLDKPIKFSNHPKKIPLTIYDLARREIIASLSENPDVLSVYEYGSVSAPGISDIDLIVILKDKPQKQFENPDGPNIRKVASGGVMIMPARVFQKLLCLDDLKLKLLYGKRIAFSAPPIKIKELRDLANVADWLPERMIRLIMILKKNPFDVQYALRYTRSFAYALENTAAIIGRKKEADDFLSKLKELRRNWQPDKSSELQALVRAGLYLGYDMLREFTREQFGKPLPVSGRLSLFSGQEIIFTNKPEQISPDWSFALSDEKTIKVFVSSALLPHFAAYAKQGGIIGRGFKNNLVISNKVIKEMPRAYQKFLKEKMAIANANAKFLKDSKFKSGQYKFGFYF